MNSEVAAISCNAVFDEVQIRDLENNRALEMRTIFHPETVFRPNRCRYLGGNVMPGPCICYPQRGDRRKYNLNLKYILKIIQ